ncbi:MAG: cytidylate kinase [Treponema sp. GWB1_62_6]|nr:MAG: cytidylate kinase [Treponema sp. GWC1_61_84]OHE70669.1 MAG: cytidylate kinase [Treponema sp. GWB1_62_6]OHE72618.1 MAG: cytidylate kinase [Treponema sp. RIFOXYC1_FULL_61_9]HCM28042.1 cytidylate kinase [Treponema sp.]
MTTPTARIAVSGKSGCGNTTVSRLIADRLGLRFINFTFRSLASEKGITLHDVLRLAKDDDWWDRAVDNRQVALARSDGGCVLGSRLAIWMLPEADLKVYLRASDETRARRIHAREGGDLSEIAAFTAGRDSQDHARYLELYGIDNDDYSIADLVVDTDRLGPEEIAEMVVEELGRRIGAEGGHPVPPGSIL